MAGEVLLTEGVVFPLWGRQQLIGLAPGLQLLPQQVSSYADAANAIAIAIAQVGVGIGYGLLEACGAAPAARAEIGEAQAPEAFQQCPIQRV